MVWIPEVPLPLVDGFTAPQADDLHSPIPDIGVRKKERTGRLNVATSGSKSLVLDR